jgi:hypothetical protein
MSFKDILSSFLALENGSTRIDYVHGGMGIERFEDLARQATKLKATR